MQFKNPHSAICYVRRFLCLCSQWLVHRLHRQQVEEVVVTGSFIRRSEGFTQASSVTQLDAVDLEQQGTLNIGEVVQNLTFVNGAASSVTTRFRNRFTFVIRRPSWSGCQGPP